MDMPDIYGILGLVFAATTSAALMHEHMTDVLYGPYIEGRARKRGVAMTVNPARAAIDDAMEQIAWRVGGAMDRLAWHADDLKLRIGWKIRNAIYLAMMA
jgi:hypothetical protein